MGEITAVTVPEADVEAVRDLVRAREDVRADLMRVRHRLSKLLLRHGRIYSQGQAWTGLHEIWLDRQRFVEAGCKAVVGQRLKLSGMRWNIPGATGILTLRCEQASNRFEHIWTRPTPGTAGRGSTAVPGIMRLCLTTEEWLSGMGLRSLPAG